MSENFYDILGVSRDADEEEIKQAYREKARQYHPDVSDDPDAEEKFKQVKKAKEVLTDEDDRAAYDQMGHDRYTQASKQGFDPGQGGQGPFGGRGGNGDPFGDINDIFDQFFGGGRGQRQRGPRKGQDLQTTLSITLEEAYEGAEKRMTVTRPTVCPECDGAGHPADADVNTCTTCDGSGQQTTVRQTPLGRVQQTQTCRDCGGKGEQYSETCARCDGEGISMEEGTLDVDIDEGVRDGQQLRMRGEGAPSPDGGPNGDLIIQVRVTDHERFERDGDDLFYRMAISFPQAVFGADIEVPTLDGRSTFDVPAGTQSGERFRLRGKGMPHFRSPGQGDLFVEVQVVTPQPKELTDDQREALEAFAEAGGEEVDVKQGFFEKIRSTF